jgi:aspartate/methionine/tyrosine aminotransferase
MVSLLLSQSDIPWTLTPLLYFILGFRLGLCITQHNEPLMHALMATSLFAQSASPAGQLWAALLNDEKYLDWYLATNRSRLTRTYDYVTTFFRSHQIPYVPGNAGHFFLIDLRAFLRPSSGTVAAQRDAEAALSSHLVANGVFVAPGAQYHHPTPGFFRFTFSLEPKALRVGLERIEKALGLSSLVKDQEAVE